MNETSSVFFECSHYFVHLLYKYIFILFYYIHTLLIYLIIFSFICNDLFTEQRFFYIQEQFYCVTEIIKYDTCTTVCKDTARLARQCRGVRGIDRIVLQKQIEKSMGQSVELEAFQRKHIYLPDPWKVTSVFTNRTKSRPRKIGLLIARSQTMG